MVALWGSDRMILLSSNWNCVWSNGRASEINPFFPYLYKYRTTFDNFDGEIVVGYEILYFIELAMIPLKKCIGFIFFFELNTIFIHLDDILRLFDKFSFEIYPFLYFTAMLIQLFYTAVEIV